MNLKGGCISPELFDVRDSFLDFVGPGSISA